MYRFFRLTIQGCLLSRCVISAELYSCSICKCPVWSLSCSMAIEVNARGIYPHSSWLIELPIERHCSCVLLLMGHFWGAPQLHWLPWSSHKHHKANSKQCYLTSVCLDFFVKFNNSSWQTKVIFLHPSIFCAVSQILLRWSGINIIGVQLKLQCLVVAQTWCMKHRMHWEWTNAIW